MKTIYDFSDPASAKTLESCVSPNCRGARAEFRQEKDAIVNAALSEAGQYEYISLLTKKKWPVGTVITTHCSFESFGAPLIVFSDDVGRTDDGYGLYGLHFEVVAFEEGCNVWRIDPAPGEPRPIRTKKIGILRFPIEGNSVIEISVKLGIGKISVAVNGVPLEIEGEGLPMDGARVGITACEGINRFYDLTVEDVE